MPRLHCPVPLSEGQSLYALGQLSLAQRAAEQAANLMAKGGHVLVSEEYRKLRKLGVGDKIELLSLRACSTFSVSRILASTTGV